MTVVLDTGPLGLLVQRPGLAPADECRAWLRSLLSSGHDACVPEICDYELRRELLRLGLNQAIDRLAQIEATLEYLPIRTQTMRAAAALWAEARRGGRPTTDSHALDGDMILVAQARGLDRAETVIATTNPGHLTLFVDAADWRTIG